MSVTFELLEETHVLLIRGRYGNHEVLLLANKELVGDVLLLARTHVEGEGSGVLGISGVRHFLQELANYLGRRYDVQWVEVQGWQRSSGARPGHWPRPVRVKVQP